MWKRRGVAAATFVCMIASTPLVFAEASRTKDPRQLVIRLKNASLEDLKKLSFIELNTLKNAVYASKGYRFADDRPWLQELFCPEVKEARLASYRFGNDEEDGEGESAPHQPDGKELEWLASMRVQAKWNLNEYAFPGCREGSQLDEDQKKALANIRIANFKKIAIINNMNEIDHAYLDREMSTKMYQHMHISILGKPLALSLYQGRARESILRDVHGYAQLWNMISNVDKDFDAMELLGLYAGDIIFLRNIIEAKYGKPTSGVVGWEISQLIGIPEIKQNYDPKKLPIKIQLKLQVLDDVVLKIMNSDLNDVPKELKDQRSIDINYDPYESAAC